MSPDQTDKAKTSVPYPPDECLAVRHMNPSVFLTYDAMIAACMSKKDKDGNKAKPTDDHEFWGSIRNIAERNNRSDDTEFRNIAWLEKERWIIDKNPDKKQQRNSRGRFETVKYKVLHHVQWAAIAKDCPPYRYDPETGEQLAAPSDRDKKILETKRQRKETKQRMKEYFDEWNARHKNDVVVPPEPHPCGTDWPVRKTK